MLVKLPAIVKRIAATLGQDAAIEKPGFFGLDAACCGHDPSGTVSEWIRPLVSPRQ